MADMGGGTLDFSAYKAVGVKPLRVEEMAAARCKCLGFLRCLVTNYVDEQANYKEVLLSQNARRHS